MWSTHMHLTNFYNAHFYNFHSFKMPAIKTHLDLEKNLRRLKYKLLIFGDQT